MSRRLLALVACALLLTACRVDVAIDVEMAQNGSGRVSVTVVADAAVVNQAPGLAADVRVDDLAAAGWTTSGAQPTVDGGLAITITHDFDTPEQATALLSTLNGPNGPLQAVRLQRVATLEDITYTVTGSGRLTGGLDAFTDADLLATVGGTPYADQIAASGPTPTDVVSVVLRVRMPGELVSSSASPETADVSVAPVTSLVRLSDTTDAPATSAPSGSELAVATTGAISSTDDSALLAFPIALDGTDTVIQGTTRYSLERGGGWSLLSTALLVLLIAWVAISIVVIVVAARRQRRRSRAARRLDRGLYRRVLDDHTR